ncbi:MAG: hypothetical protein AAFU79_06545 [Myxococcota bacterium]
MKAFWSHLRVEARRASAASPAAVREVPSRGSNATAEASARVGFDVPSPNLSHRRLPAAAVRVTWGGVEQQLDKAMELLRQGPASPPTRSRVGALLHQAAEAVGSISPESLTDLPREELDALGLRLGRQLDDLLETCPPFGTLTAWGSAGVRIIEAITRLARRLDRCRGLPLCDSRAANALEAQPPRDRAELAVQLSALDAGRPLSVSSTLRRRLKLTVSSSSKTDRFRVEDRLREKKGQLIANAVRQGLLTPAEALDALEQASPDPLLAAYAEGSWPDPGSPLEARNLRNFLLRQGLHPSLASTLLRVGIAEGDGPTDGNWERTVADRIFSRHVVPDRGGARALALPHLEHSDVESLVKELTLRAAELPRARREALAHLLIERREEAERSARSAGLPDVSFDGVAKLAEALRSAR